MSSMAATPLPASDLPAACQGVVALSARLEDWQLELLERPELLGSWLELHGSPLNLLAPSGMERNAAALQAVAAKEGVDFQIFFARKANKALGFVDEARRLGLGVDLAGERELVQTLSRGLPPDRTVMTAAVKPSRLLELCIFSGTTVVIDNHDELQQLAKLAQRSRREVAVALRLAVDLGAGRLQTRFGFQLGEAMELTRQSWPPELRIEGVHFHLDGYAPQDRVSAISGALRLVDQLRDRGHEPRFVDIGGGIPISYLDSGEQWEHFWSEHRRALLGERPPLTFDGHGLGLLAHRGEVIGEAGVYPYYQQLTGGAWLAEILAATVGDRTVAESLRARSLQLRCEPGRALLDGCGMTTARVAFRKQRRDGTWLIGLEMNRTQCRSTSEDFLVDPLLISAVGSRGERARESDATGPIEGYLVGAYCIERELLSWRRFTFPRGVRVGDIVVFPNTAGYLMHILESSSHQMPLAQNLIVASGRPPVLDPIDQSH